MKKPAMHHSCHQGGCHSALSIFSNPHLTQILVKLVKIKDGALFRPKSNKEKAPRSGFFTLTKFNYQYRYYPISLCPDPQECQ